ncbi:MAG: filamentous hemagglutinin N-terminal domain-containing protein [Rhizomicrobium sp.]|jgi:filamentous hemagglutinin family protein
MTIHAALHRTLKSSASFDWSRAAASRMGAGLAVALCAAPALANPLNGAVTTGSASIATSSNKTQIDQKSEDVVIDWSSFNVGAGQTTQFVQPNAQAIAVNRIGGNAPSQILGTLDANGRIVLINGNGMLFGNGSQVNVGSLVATSTGGSDSDVLAGKFTQAGNRNAAVVNRGRITASQSGLVALVAPSVTNAGMVNAKLGTVALGAANKFTIDFTGDGLVSFAAQGDVNSRASATNTGSLVGANVSMTAHAANGLATGVVDMSGVIEAQGVQNVGGTIYLDAGNGTLTTTGTLNAAGVAGGGHIETSGRVANISGHITAGQGGQWKVDPEDLTINSKTAATIDGALNSGTSVLEQTTSGAASGAGKQTSGAGDIIVASALSWNTTATLTLDSYHSIDIDAPITISGAGGFVLQYNGAATDGILSFGLGSKGFAGNVSYGPTDNGGTLSINGTPYTLIYSVSDLQNINANLRGNYALAGSINASGATNWTPIGTDGPGDIANSGNGFSGTFEGLGNGISNLSVNTGADNYAGLFGYSSGIIRDVGVVAGSVNGYAYVGVLAGNSAGAIDSAYATGTVTGHFYVGGLAGSNEGQIGSSFAGASVTGGTDVGGLVGDNLDTGGENQTITNSYATGTVSGTTDVGGLVGSNYATSSGSVMIAGSYATGAVTGVSLPGDGAEDIGGLVGGNYHTGAGNAVISDSYATGSVEADGITAGLAGLVGESLGTITGSYSTGEVIGAGLYDYAAGGLVAVNDYGGVITDCYSTSNVINGGSYVGGLVGASDGPISNSYSVGMVSGYSIVGGFVGLNNSAGVLSDSYWDTKTSGTNVGVAVDDNDEAGNVKPETTATLQASLLPGLSGPTWAIAPGSFPYLQWQIPSGTPTVIEGYTFGSNGAVATSVDVGVVVDGLIVDPSVTMSSAANGYYYLLLAPGTISTSGSDVVAYAGAIAGNTFVQGLAGTANTLDIYANTLEMISGAGNSGALTKALSQAVGSNDGSQFLYTAAAGFAPGYDDVLDESAPVFEINSSLDFGSGTLDLESSGRIVENASQGSVVADRLEGASNGGASFGGQNRIDTLGAFTNTGGGGFSLRDVIALDVVGAVDSGIGGLALTTTNGASITIGSELTSGSSVDLNSAGQITESIGGIAAAGLAVSANGAATLNGTNLIGTLSGLSDSGGAFSLIDGESLTTKGTIDAGDNSLTLQTTSGNIDIASMIEANTLTLESAGKAHERSDGAIDVGLLNVTAQTGIDLDSADNDIATIGTDTTASGPNKINKS